LIPEVEVEVELGRREECCKAHSESLILAVDLGHRAFEALSYV